MVLDYNKIIPYLTSDERDDNGSTPFSHTKNSPLERGVPKWWGVCNVVIRQLADNPQD